MTPLVSHAQNFEDVLLWRAVGDIGPGVYVDIGAQSPDVDSVSRLFFERGWRGVHVEPVPEYAQALRERRPGDVVVQAAVGREPGLHRFHVFADTGLSTLDDAVARQHVDAGREEAVLQVPVVTLDDVLAEAGPEVHWLKIDVEGAEADVLQGWRGESRPWVVVVEATRPMSQELAHHAWEPLLLARGYTFALFDGLNRFYVADAHADRLSRLDHGACVFDGFALGADSTAPFASAHRATVRALEQAHVGAETALAAAQAESVRVTEAWESASAARDVALADLASARKTFDDAQARHAQETTEIAERHAARLEAQAAEYVQRMVAQETAHHATLEAVEVRHRGERTALEARHAAERARLQLEREALQGRFDEQGRDVQWLHAELGVQRDRTLDALEDARRWQTIAQNRAVELAQVYSSTSWRITGPLRSVVTTSRRARGGLQSLMRRCRGRLRTAVIGVLRWLGRSRLVRRVGAHILRPFPGIERRARWAVQHQLAGTEQPLIDPSPDRRPVPAIFEPEPALSPYGNALLKVVRQHGRAVG